ncbi:MAG TPA: 50S ribosomal protein L23 [Desulfobacterales bacterium]|nr:50S ribosomal protein L23 [Desulfobacterales bacterium]
MNLYDVIKKPIITEKATMLDGKVVVKVDKRANKIEIKEAMEKLFNVKVAHVRTVSMRGKQKRLGRHFGRTSDWKKAYVTLAEGEKLDFLQEL